MEQIKSNKTTSIILLAVNFLLLISYLGYGFVTEDEGIRNMYIAIAFTFACSVTFCIYYKQNYKTLPFWLTVIISGVFIIATLLFMYFTALGQADWR